MNLLLLEPEEIASDGRIEIFGRRAEHICAILRAREGDPVKTGVVNGKMGIARVVRTERRAAVLQLESLDTNPPPKRELIPIIAMTRPRSLKKLLHFIASFGLPKAYLIDTARVEKSFWKSSAAMDDEMRSSLLLGLEQGVDTILPELVLCPSFREFVKPGGMLEQIPENALKLIAHPVNATECPRGVKGPAVVLIGPEGGFIPSEVELFTGRGFRAVELGPHILRVEYALAVLAGRLC